MRNKALPLHTKYRPQNFDEFIGNEQVVESLKIISVAESLGVVESLIEHPASMTHASISAEDRAKIGLSDGLIRLSVGIEDADDLIADISQALNAV